MENQMTTSASKTKKASKWIALALLLAAMFPVWIAGHEATHCTIALAAGAPDCSITMFPSDCGQLTRETATGSCWAYAEHVAVDDGIPAHFDEIIAHIGGLAFPAGIIILLELATGATLIPARKPRDVPRLSDADVKRALRDT